MSIESSKARESAAAPGPWDWEDPYRLEQPLEFGQVVTSIDQFESKPSAADRTFIAHARADIPALLAVAEAARDVMVHVEHEECDAPWCVSLRAALEALEALP